MQADIKFAKVPTNIAFSPRRARSDLRDGASAPIPPIWMAIELRLAKPQSANVAIVKERGSRADLTLPRSTKATNSLSTMRVPSRVPTVAQSFQVTPSAQAMGAKRKARICCKEAGNQGM